jgi:hypothetical protein
MKMNFQALSFRVITVILFSFFYFTSFGQYTALQRANKKTVIRYFDEVVNT